MIKNNSKLISYSIPFLTGILMYSEYYVYKKITKNRNLSYHYYH